MTTEAEKAVDCATKTVRMYPNNQLKPQVRDLSETLSAFQVIADVVKR